MNFFIRAIDRFCARHRRFGFPRLMMYIVIATSSVFLLCQMDGTGSLLRHLWFNPNLILQGEVWRLFSWLFIPMNDNILFFAITMYFYYFIGTTLEREWGTAKFTIYFGLGVIFNIGYGFLYMLLEGSYVPLTPMYLNLSMFFVFASMFPDMQVLVFFIIPVKMKWLALLDAAVFVISIGNYLLAGEYFLSLMPVVSILNFFLFCGFSLRRASAPLRNRVSKGTIEFKKASREINKDAKNREYRHKCAVCGKTDTEYPSVQFRYCSKCNGFHCFCSEHIDNHIHFTE